jgi:hypothetical protein
VTVGVLMAFGPRNSDGQQTGPAIKDRGYPCLGRIKINSHQQRVEGLADATLTVDGDQWDGLEEAKQLAILDHEILHLEVKRDEEGNFKLDDSNRPKLKIKLHDLVVGGFATIVHRHGRNAVEYEQVAAIHTMNRVLGQHGQMMFPFMNGEAGTKTVTTNGAAPQLQPEEPKQDPMTSPERGKREAKRRKKLIEPEPEETTTGA